MSFAKIASVSRQLTLAKGPPIFNCMFRFLFLIFRLLLCPASTKELALENLALRQQMAVMRR